MKHRFLKSVHWTMPDVLTFCNLPPFQEHQRWLAPGRHRALAISTSKAKGNPQILTIKWLHPEMSFTYYYVYTLIKIRKVINFESANTTVLYELSFPSLKSHFLLANAKSSKELPKIDQRQ